MNADRTMTWLCHSCTFREKDDEQNALGWQSHLIEEPNDSLTNPLNIFYGQPDQIDKGWP